LTISWWNEEKQKGREGDDGGERCLRLGFLDRRAAHGVEAGHHRHRAADELERQYVEAGQQADHGAHDQFGRHQQHQRVGTAAREWRDEVPQMHQNGAGGRDGHEEAYLQRHAHARQAGHQHEAGADPAEGKERGDDEDVGLHRHHAQATGPVGRMASVTRSNPAP
jgi:hypothetical protein